MMHERVRVCRDKENDSWAELNHLCRIFVKTTFDQDQRLYLTVPGNWVLASSEEGERIDNDTPNVYCVIHPQLAATWLLRHAGVTHIPNANEGDSEEQIESADMVNRMLNEREV